MAGTEVKRVKTSVACTSPDDPCFTALATKSKSDGDGAYPWELVLFSTELISTAEGGRLSFRLIIRNPTTVDFGPFDIVVSPATILQGRPVQRPSGHLLHIESLASGAIGAYFVNDLNFALPDDRRFTCRDSNFTAPAPQ